MLRTLAILLFITLFTGCSGGSEESGISVPPSNTSAGSNTSSITINDSLAPANGTYGENSSLNFQIEYSGNVFVQGNISIDISIGGIVKKAIYQSGSGTASIEFSYLIQAGDNDSDGISLVGAVINLNGGSLKDENDLDLELGLGSQFSNLNSILVNSSTPGPNQVTNLTTAPTTSDTSVSLSWSKPNDNGSTINQYIVQYRLTGSQSWIQYSPSPSINSLTITGLAANTSYDFRVAASNGILGPYSDISSFEAFNIMSLNPIAWLDATDINGDGSSLADGSLVSAWVDKSGIATDAVEAEVIKQPTYQENVINGLPAVYFNNLDRGLEGTFERTVNAGLTIFVVGYFDSSKTDKCIFEFYKDNNRAFFIDRRFAGNSYFSPALTKGSFKVWRVEDSGTVSSVYENDSPIQSNTNNTFNTSFTGTGSYVLGDDKTGGNRMTGYIAEFLVFDGILTNGDAADVENYLNQKWGL